MPRGKASQVGDTNISANGYHYTRTEDGWRLTHHIVAEKTLGRAIDPTAETVRFKDGDKTNFDPDNIVVQPKNKKSVGGRIAKLTARQAEIAAQLELLQNEQKLEAKS